MTSSRKMWEFGKLGEWDKKGASMEAGREHSQPRWKVATRVMFAVSGRMICDIFDSCHRVKGGCQGVNHNVIIHRGIVAHRGVATQGRLGGNKDNSSPNKNQANMIPDSNNMTHVKST